MWPTCLSRIVGVTFHTTPEEPIMQSINTYQFEIIARQQMADNAGRARRQRQFTTHPSHDAGTPSSKAAGRRPWRVRWHQPARASVI